MKQYLLVGVAVLLVSAYASDNPFDVTEHFGILDKEQQILFENLAKEAEKQELATEESLENSVKEEVLQEVIEEKVEVLPIVDAIPVENISSPSEDMVDVIREKALEESKEGVLNDVRVQTEPTSDESSIDTKQQEDEIETQKELETQEEAEKREVEAYEKQKRLKANALEEEASAEEARIRRLERLEAERKLTQDTTKIAKKLVNSLTDTTQISEESMSDEQRNTLDINVTRDKLEAKFSADKAYEEAVNEMSQED